MIHRARLLFLLILLANFASAQNDDSAECSYAGRVVLDLDDPSGGKIIKRVKGVDEDSGEATYTYIIEFDNRDVASAEQKYCSMYNMSVVYKIRKLDEGNFARALNAIGEIVRSVQQDYLLHGSLKSIVEMTRRENNLSLESEFDIGLPAWSAISSEYVEHAIRFKPLDRLYAFDAEIEFYFALGGE